MPTWKFDFENDEFRQALVQSLSSVGLSGQSRTAPRYYLTPTLVTANVGPGGPIFTPQKGTCVIAYRLKDMKTGKVIYEKPIGSTHIATSGDYYPGALLKKAKEGAIKVSIQRLIEDLVLLKLE